MSGAIRLKGASSGYIDIIAPDSGTNTAINTGLLVYKDSANGTITSTSTNDIPEGSNLYYTTARFDSDFATKDLHDSVAVQAQIDSAAVTLTGNQTIAGTKTFSDDPVVERADPSITLKDTSSASAIGSSNLIKFVNSTGTVSAQVGNNPNQDGGQNFSIGTNVGYGLNFYTQDSSRMVINSAGNVGIGTTNPAGPLQVNVGTNQNIAINSNGGVARLSAYNDAVSASVPLHIQGQPITLRSGNSDTVTIDSAGNVGIGTTNPASKLHVNGNVTVGSSAAGPSSTGVIAYSSGTLVVRGTITNNELAVFDNYNGSGWYQIDFRWNNAEVGSVQVASTGTTYNTTSDIRLKDNISSITDAKEKLMSMNPVTHTWISNPESPAVHGFIAQEMQKIIPEAVNGDPKSDEMMSMDYGRITPILVAALQDALEEIEELKLKIERLESSK